MGRQRHSINETHITSLGFDRMTARLISKADGSLGVKGPNVYLGNKALRGLSLNDERFENINKEPIVSSAVKNSHLPKWNLNSDRHIDFRLKVYNRNVYKPSSEITNRRIDQGHQKMKVKIGRDE